VACADNDVTGFAVIWVSFHSPVEAKQLGAVSADVPAEELHLCHCKPSTSIDSLLLKMSLISDCKPCISDEVGSNLSIPSERSTDAETDCPQLITRKTPTIMLFW